MIKKYSLVFSFVSLSLLIVLLLGFFIRHNYCRSNKIAFSIFGKSPITNQDKVSKGYTLYTTLSAPTPSLEDKPGSVYLVDLTGRPVHEWKTSKAPFYSVLKPNGNLVVSFANPNINSKFPAAANTPTIAELDWQGNVVWEYKNDSLHHDFDVFPNGHLALTSWIELPREFQEKVEGGIKNSELKGGRMLSDEILEIDKDKNVVWSWKAMDHLNPADFPLDQLSTRSQWTQLNSIKYVKNDPFLGEEAYLISLRTINTVTLIRKSNGEIIWKSPNNLLNHQHDATLLKNGHILVFDNGFFTRPLQDLTYGSRVVEIDPKTNQIVWQFSGGENPLDKAGFFSSILGGAQRLKNGNTLITLGVGGHMLEVTEDQQIVWDMVNPFANSPGGSFPSNHIFKARRYAENEINWPTKLRPSLPVLNAICY